MPVSRQAIGIEQIENKSLRPRLAAGYRMASKFDARMMSMAWKSARNAEIEKLPSEGASYAALARQFELSPSRVQQIIANTRRLRKRLQVRLAAPLRHTTRVHCSPPLTATPPP